MRFYKSMCCAFAVISVLVTVVACSGNSSPTTVVVNGTVSSGGSAPAVAVSGATVVIYQAQTGSPKPLVQTTTDGAGNFSAKVPISSGGSSSNPNLYYALATKSPGIVLMASLGSAPLTAVKINDLTTVASAYAFAQFFQSDFSIAGPSIPLSIAAGMAENLVSAESGGASLVMQTSPNGYETNAWSALGTLANKLAACTQALTSGCTNLFAVTLASNGALPINTLQAAVNIARNPASNVSAIFNLANGTNAYAPALAQNQGPGSTAPLQKLDAWTMAVKVNNSGNPNCPFGGPANVAFDLNGYAWINNNVIQGTPNSANCLIVLQPNGKPATGLLGKPNSPITGGGILGSGFGIAIDTLNNIWSGNFGWGDTVPSLGSVSKLSSTGIPLSPPTGYTNQLLRVQGTAVDASNTIWMASYGNNQVVVYRNGNSATAASFNDNNTEPFGIAIAGDGSAWVSYTGSDSVSKLKLSNGGISRVVSVALPAGSNPKGIAVDSLGNAWVAAGATSQVFVINSSGSIVGTYSGQGINGPWGISIDANDRVWVANFGTNTPSSRYSIVQLCGATTANCPAGVSMGTAITPSSGYTLPSAGSQVLLNSGAPLYGTGAPPSFLPLMRLTSVNADMAGNIWAANNWKPSGLNDLLLNPGGDGMVIFVGVATPTNAPTLGPAKAIQ